MYSQNELDTVLTKQNWTLVNTKLLAKMISEFMYEDMISPQLVQEKDSYTIYDLRVSDKKSYTFHAIARQFDSYDVDWKSIRILENGNEVEGSAVGFLLDIKPLIGMSSETTAHLIKEISQTLIADVHLLNKRVSSDKLITEDYANLEGYMTGHPWITYNKGRIGFGYDDYLAYAPEHQNEVTLSWIGVSRQISSFQSIEELTFEKLVNYELNEQDRSKFQNILEEKTDDPSQYFMMPVHEWQWKNVLIQNFTEEIANQTIIPLGQSSDRYLPQQSIRTFVNKSNPNKHHVKLPMSILNTLVYRGLPAERTLIAPKITEFIKGIYEKDSFLKDECRVILPGEIASINVNHSYYNQLENAPYQYKEMLGVIFRESIYTYLEEGEQAITLAALLYEDHNGKPYIKSLIEKSGMSTEEWMTQFFDVTMKPLLHYLYQYGTVFSPHGQNTILVLKDSKPSRLAIKDFVDDVNISDQPFEELNYLTDELKDVLRSEPPEGLTQFIFTGLFICHLRYLSNILANGELMEEQNFWEKLAESILSYQARFPHLEERYKLFDFFKPTFTKLCLNRNRMVDEGYSVGEDRPHASEFGKVRNALSHYKKITK
ncbi:IucA/IucC family siderophore biosynthesis protein [Alkalihalobacillus hwajinpoensis]|uniref:IucA/IucC family protein n=1 Tax=Guptibacillus hwajinpoensis TaxID=208199 RepID=UPI0018841275|nr:IucA/IucC family siderophore biosynthesis protein [Pseudalkalibacillus hwajinpoensis]MBF0708775.1 IucA/IucC family siderophore biosynthesis protein [Pseudalkalibacillus hwajinpoensis]